MSIGIIIAVWVIGFTKKQDRCKMVTKLKIGNCIKITKGKYAGTKASIIRKEKGSYLAENANATFRVYDGWIEKVNCTKIRSVR